MYEFTVEGWVVTTVESVYGCKVRRTLTVFLPALYRFYIYIFSAVLNNFYKRKNYFLNKKAPPPLYIYENTEVKCSYL